MIFKNYITWIENRFIFPVRIKTSLELVALLLVIAIGIMVRLDGITDWHENPNTYFVDGEPVQSSADAYFYLSLAKDLVEDNYPSINEKRSVPDSPARPVPPPLISVLAAVIAKTTSISVIWLGAILPVFLGTMLAIPVYLLGSYYGGFVMGITSSLLSVLYPIYVVRGGLGRFDTDCMNVTLTMSIAYCFLRFGVEDSRTRYWYLAGGGAVYVIFLWWWDQAPHVVTAITLLPLCVALVFFYRPGKQEALVFLGFSLSAITLILLWKGENFILDSMKYLSHAFQYITKSSYGDFPNPAASLSEQVKPSISRIVSITTTNIPSFLFAIIGVVALLWRRFKTSLFLISAIILSGLSLIAAQRFSIYLAPVLALGTGFSLAALWQERHHFTALYVLCPALMLLLIWPLLEMNKSAVPWAPISGHTAKAMAAIKEKTESDSVIWTWWDQSYALQYFAERATISDGSDHGGEISVYNAIPLSQPSTRLAANFIHFYVARGRSGITQLYRATGGNRARGLSLIKSVLGAGPVDGKTLLEAADLKSVDNWRSTDDWLHFFYPDNKRPVYLFLNAHMVESALWWYWFGSWDIDQQRGRHPIYMPLADMKKDGSLLISDQGLAVDIRNGNITIKQKVRRIVEIIRGKNPNDLNEGKQLRFESANPWSREGILMDVEIAESVFNQLFLRNIDAKGYFRPIFDNFPSYQLWKVEAESIADQESRDCRTQSASC